VLGEQRVRGGRAVAGSWHRHDCAAGPPTVAAARGGESDRQWRLNITWRRRAGEAVDCLALGPATAACGVQGPLLAAVAARLHRRRAGQRPSRTGGDPREDQRDGQGEGFEAPPHGRLQVAGQHHVVKSAVQCDVQPVLLVWAAAFPGTACRFSSAAPRPRGIFDNSRPSPRLFHPGIGLAFPFSHDALADNELRGRSGHAPLWCGGDVRRCGGCIVGT